MPLFWGAVQENYGPLTAPEADARRMQYGAAENAEAAPTKSGPLTRNLKFAATAPGEKPRRFSL